MESKRNKLQYADPTHFERLKTEKKKRVRRQNINMASIMEVEMEDHRKTGCTDVAMS